MKKLFLTALIATVGGVGCKEINTDLNVKQEFTLNLKKKGKTLTLQPGVVNAEIKVDPEDNEIELKVKDEKGKKQKAKFKVSAGKVIPTSNGTIEVEAAESGQNVDLLAEIKTTYSTSGIYNATEYCTYPVKERHCFKEKVCVTVSKRGPRTRGRRTGGETEVRCHYKTVCGYRTVYVSGHKEVQYHYSYTNIKVTGELEDPQNGDLIAELNGSKSLSDKVYDYVGPCY